MSAKIADVRCRRSAIRPATTAPTVSLHVDVNPGDRAADCGGILDPIRADPDPKKGFIITHKCRKCGAIRRNKAAADDDRTLLIRLTAGLE